MAHRLTEEDVLHQIEAERRRRLDGVRQMLRDGGHHEALAEMDANLRNIDLGITGARSTWAALTEPQRRCLRVMAEGNRRLVRARGSRHFFDAIGEPEALSRVATLPTLRNLERRELLSWDGGAFAPEAAAVLTERARFVLKHGPRPQGE